MLHFNIDISNYKESKLNSFNYIPVLESEIADNSIKLQHYYNCKNNFEINMNRFKSLNKMDFNKKLQDFLNANHNFVEVTDLNQCEFAGYYIMVLDEYCQIYIGTTKNIKDRIVQHWKKKMPFERLIFGSVESSKISIDSFFPLDTTRIYVYKTDIIYNDENKYINAFPNEYILNRTVGGKLANLNEAYINRKEYNGNSDIEIVSVEPIVKYKNLDTELSMVELMKMFQCSRNKIINLYVYDDFPLRKRSNKYYALKREVDKWYDKYLERQEKEKITTIVWSVIIIIVLIVFMFWAIMFVFEF